MLSRNETRKRSIIAGAMLITAGLLAGILFTAGWDLTGSSTAQNAAPPVNYRYASNIPLLTDTGESPFVAVAERVAPTLVNITSDRTVSRNTQMEDFFRDSPFFEFFHRDMPQPRQRERSVPATGSGIIISRDGYILTNNHVVDGADRVTVKTLNGRDYKATIIGKDPETDVALIKVDHQFEPQEVALTGNSDALKVGDWAIAMGNPLGLDWTLTVGVVSAKGRSNLAIAGGGPSYQNFIQTDASINFGNSGGPLCNIHGEVIGVNSAINPSGQGIGFAIPINMAMKVVDQLRDKGSVSRGYLGMLPRELSSDLRSALGIPSSESGIFVERVDRNTPAEGGGLKAGDVITKFGGQDVEDVAKFRMLVADYPPGSSVTCEVLRDGKKQNLSFVLGDRGELATLFGRGGAQPNAGKDSWLGIEVEPVTSEVARALELDGTYGVVITDVDPAGPAANKLRERDVVIEIDRKEVNSLADFKRIAGELKNARKAVLFRLIRNGQKTFEAVEQ